MSCRGLVACSIALALGMPAAATGPSDLPKVSEVRHWSLGEITRVAIEISGEASYHAERLEHPDRIFFDVKARYAYRKPKIIQVGDGVLRKIRVAETQPGRTRVVLDLEERAEFTISKLENPERLIIELRAKDGALRSAKTVVSAALPSPPRVDPPARIMADAKPALPVSGPPPAEEARDRAVSATPAGPGAEEAPIGAAVAAKRGITGSRSMTRVLGLKIGRIVIDPGHGGHDAGTIGVGGLTEKELVLDVARRVGALIEERLGSEVIYTRSTDAFVALEHRTAIANEKKADLFLSIHANSSPIPSASGVETYYLNFTTSKDALDVAARENASSQKSVHELRDLLQKIALKDKVEESREFASRVQTSLYGTVSKNGPKNRDRGVKKAPFVVLIGASMPSVLAEIGFVSNPHEGGLLQRPEYRQKIAEALYKGLAQYAETLSHFQVARQ